MSSVLGGMMATRVVRGGQTNVISTPGESDDTYGESADITYGGYMRNNQQQHDMGESFPI